MLPGTFNPIAFGPGFSFVGSDTYSRTGTGNVDHDFTISGVQAGDLLVLAFTFDGTADGSWGFATGSGGLTFTTIYDVTSNSTMGPFVGYTTATGSLLRVQTFQVGSTAWPYLSMVLAAYRGPTTLVASDTTAPLSITNTGFLTILTGHATEFTTPFTAVAPSGYTVSGEQTVGGVTGSATAIAHSFSDVTNPAATLDWSSNPDNETFTMALFS